MCLRVQADMDMAMGGRAAEEVIYGPDHVVREREGERWGEERQSSKGSFMDLTTW